MSVATITSKGQVTIPKSVRKTLDLRAGDRIVFMIEGEQAILMLVRQRDIMQLRGALPATVPFTNHQDIREAAGRQRAQELAQEGAA